MESLFQKPFRKCKLEYNKENKWAKHSKVDREYTSFEIGIFKVA